MQFPLFWRALPIGFLLVVQAVAQPASAQSQDRIQELKAAAESSPDSPMAHFQLAMAYGAQQWELAVAELKWASELYPIWVPPRLALGQLQVTHAKYDDAFQTAAGVLVIDPNSINARLIQSAALMGQKKFEDARRLVDELRESHAESPDVWFQLGVVNLESRRFREAEDAFRRAYELNPANSRGLLGMVETYMAQNRLDDALKLLQDEYDKAPDRRDLLLALGNTAVRAGKYEQAIAAFQKVLDRLEKGSEAQGDIWLRIGETYRRKGDFQAAAQALQKARETLPDNVVVLSTLALILDSAGRTSEARQVYEATLKVDPNNAIALNNLAYLLSEHGGDLDDALAKVKRARQILPSLDEITDTLGWVYLKRQETDLAIGIFRELVAKQPGNAMYHYHLGAAYAQKGDRSNARAELEKALELKPTADQREKITALLATLGK